ncbi:hypothetical protein [Maridesulfovibrio hydrothermalis]|uniref:Uncharacterized protein n=1 Tax=Maridesulfovibrio hydrothermalis AM13 = DSM 14728 TaxID=1121451 RepID=L0R8D8_9BACT|nr:hypothetical protein [Maridesulfovibrio hydrothermalis]CCO22482.1 protein of unknown function [Maridesulfovibrio hydrothermalis AM13 = DSM 14728]
MTASVEITSNKIDRIESIARVRRAEIIEELPAEEGRVIIVLRKKEISSTFF